MKFQYTNHERSIIRICSISSSSISILSGLIAFYNIGLIHPKKRVFRQELIFILIIFDFIKSIMLLIYPCIVEYTNESILNGDSRRRDRFINSIGWFTSFSIEGADLIILCFAIHIAMLIFKKKKTKQLKTNKKKNSDGSGSGGSGSSGSNEGGLYTFKYLIYGLSILIPILLASLTFAGGLQYQDQISWSYMKPLSVLWFMTWIIRYCIVIIILIIYGSIYYHVMKEYRSV
ncbi:hypothetical protein CANARDRAFT_203844, partial [[Candida] arabinofermentans NRRL YB-2248]